MSILLLIDPIDFFCRLKKLCSAQKVRKTLEPRVWFYFDPVIVIVQVEGISLQSYLCCQLLSSQELGICGKWSERQLCVDGDVGLIPSCGDLEESPWTFGSRTAWLAHELGGHLHFAAIHGL
jgi:hypothetical protein